jgi:hypothetical protein
MCALVDADAWKLRGRGWQEFPWPVALEPPFRPFPGYYLPPIRDDGHRPGLLARLLVPPKPEPAAPEIEELEPENSQAEDSAWALAFYLAGCWARPSPEDFHSAEGLFPAAAQS